MLINDIHIFVKFLKAEGQNIYHTPEQLDDVINRACLDLFRQEEKKFEETQIITDTLGLMKKRYAPTLIATGAYVLPTDYVRMTNLSFDIDTITVTPYLPEESYKYCDDTFREDGAVGTKTVEVYQGDVLQGERTFDVDANGNEIKDPLANLEHPINTVVDSEWINKQKSSAYPVTEEKPIARIYGRTLEVLPKTITPIIYYLKLPIKGVWAYTVSGDTYSTIFDESNSTDIDFPEIAHNEIVEKVMSLLGVPLRDGILTQFEQMQKRNNNER